MARSSSEPCLPASADSIELTVCANMRGVEIGHRGGDVGEHGEALLGHFGDAAEHHDLLLIAAGDHGEDARTDHRHHRRVVGEHAEIALDAGDVDLIDLAGEGELFGRNQIEVEGGHLGTCE